GNRRRGRLAVFRRRRIRHRARHGDGWRPDCVVMHDERGGQMEIKPSGSQASMKGPTDWFTGNVRIDPLFPAVDPSRVSSALVTFEPGARTACPPIRRGRSWSAPSGAAGRSGWGGPNVESAPEDWSW